MMGWSGWNDWDLELGSDDHWGTWKASQGKLSRGQLLGVSEEREWGGIFKGIELHRFRC